MGPWQGPDIDQHQCLQQEGVGEEYLKGYGAQPYQGFA